MEDVIWQLEVLQFIGAVTTFIFCMLCAVCFFIWTTDSVKDVLRFYRLYRDAGKLATPENPRRYVGSIRSASLVIARSVVLIAASFLLGLYSWGIFVKYVLVMSGG